MLLEIPAKSQKNAKIMPDFFKKCFVLFQTKRTNSYIICSYQKKGGALGYTRNRKTEEKFIQNRKTANEIGQNRTPQPKLFTQIGPNRKKEIGKTKNHIGYQNRKTASIFYENRKPDAKKQKIRKTH